MRRLGVHTSIAGGLHLSLGRAHALGCTTMQIFTHNPRGWALRPIPDEERRLFRKLKEELDIAPVYAHASYLINIASADASLRERSAQLLIEEMARADALGADYVVLHTGTAYDPGGKERAARSIREALKGRRSGAGLLIENTAGKNGDVAPRIEDLALLMERADGLVAGICLDSCHAFAAGYDIRDSKGLRALSAEVERLVGPGSLKLIHLNDSKGRAGSRADRHEHIGMGEIGLAALRRFVRHRPFRGAPVVLETPKKSDADDLRNLAAARSLFSR